MVFAIINLIRTSILLPTKTFAASVISDPRGAPVQNKEAVSSLVTRLTQIVIGVAGIVAVVMIILGGVLYLTSGGNEERRGNAKKTLTAAIVGLIITISAYSIVYIFTNLLGGGIS
jgi:cytochrome bd-type quinol oxidase subunit 2